MTLVHAEGEDAFSVPTEPEDDCWSRLERLARSATPGPYYYGRSNGSVGGKPEDGSMWGYAPVWTNARTAEARNPVVGKVGNHVAQFKLHSDDAVYFAALDPATVLALIAAARAGTPQAAEAGQ